MRIRRIAARTRLERPAPASRGNPRPARPLSTSVIQACAAGLATCALAVAAPPELSGIYPHLAMFNEEGECGTGAVVPWAGRLWVVTYGPHLPKGSSDKLYEISADLEQVVRPESIGGTPANRLIHRESGQLFIGPYAIDESGGVRTIPYTQMFGRPTGNARHLTDPAHKIYCATMEEGIYEIDVATLAVRELWTDEQRKEGRHAGLPGYHGKGLYSGQGRLIYANNGEHGAAARTRPETPSGALAEWDGRADRWTVVRRSQFTEVTGPGGLYGNDAADDPVWSIGWDHRSLILMCRDGGDWHAFRLPKASHSYDGAHGWNTEWPRIRDIGADDLLMTMHGMFWRFPRTFRPGCTAGIAPRSTYLKVIGDFCRWDDRLVFGCDDTAKNEFLNTRKAKGRITAPQSQSNLWFLAPERLDRLGPAIGRGGVWLDDDVAADAPSEPYLASGFARRGLHLAHSTPEPARITLETDAAGDGRWRPLREVELPAGGSRWIDLSADPPAVWIRLRSDCPLARAIAWFTASVPDDRAIDADPLFAGLASAADGSRLTGGTVAASGDGTRTLRFAAQEPGPSGPRDIGLYELDGSLRLRRVADPAALERHERVAAIPPSVLTADAASLVYEDDQGRRWRLPRGTADAASTGPLGPVRICREVATERDLFNAGGTFFELPAENAGGFAKVRPVATHARQIVDYCSYRGLFIVSGVRSNAAADDPHVLRSDDGRTALWAGAIDDVWRLGRPRGVGGPWLETAVRAGEPSDPYLLTGYDRRTMLLSHTAPRDVTLRVECDVTGRGHWLPYRAFTVAAGSPTEHEFPAAFAACWLRVIAASDCVATVQLTYE